MSNAMPKEKALHSEENKAMNAFEGIVDDVASAARGMRCDADALTPAADPFAAAKTSFGGMLAPDFLLGLAEADPEAAKKMVKTAAKELGAVHYAPWKAALNGLRDALNDRREPAPWEIDVDPWPEKVDLRPVVRELEELIGSVMYCPPEALTAAAYFSLATWFVDHVDYAPYFFLTAATRQCGKSTALSLMRKLSRRAYPLGASSTAASVYRLLESDRATLFCDEVDTYLKENKELQGVLNCGNDRNGAFIARCEKDGSGRIVNRTFNCFGFKVFSGIRSDEVGSALVDRGIVVRLKPIPKKARKSKLKERDIDAEKFATLCRKMARLAEDYGPKIRAMKREERPAFPDSFSSRECDKWELIFTLAAFCGPEEMKRVKGAALKLKGEEPKNQEWQRELLEDVREIVIRAKMDPTKTGFNLNVFDGSGGGRFSIEENPTHGEVVVAANLNEALKANPDMPWRTWGRKSEGLIVAVQTKALSPFGVKSLNVKVNKAPAKCYPLDGEGGLKVAFETYLDPMEADENAEEGA